VILALETSTASASSAVVGPDGVVLGESRRDADPLQSRRLLEGVHAALTEAGASIDDIATVVCGLGPGTFTGLRIGVATARALAQAAGREVGGVPSLEALAIGLAAGAAGASADLFVPLIDGRRNEVFAAVYRRSGAADSSVMAPALRPELDLRTVRADELGSFLAEHPGAVVGGGGVGVSAC
jgi:tRNA threonylcarbamoyladenosine biosynthesis protein TsaB